MNEVKEVGDIGLYEVDNWDVSFMQFVYQIARRSKDPSSKIGAVIVKDKRPILFGYNGFPEGVKDTPERLTERETKYMLVEHAERNAIDMAARFGIKTKGGVLYTQVLPCSSCAKGIVQAKIKEVVLHRMADNYFQNKSSSSVNWKKDHEFTKIIFEEAGVVVRFVEEYVGMLGYMGGKKLIV
jgi:dCMP deaminase